MTVTAYRSVYERWTEMVLGIVKNVFGNYNEKELKKLWPLVAET